MELNFLLSGRCLCKKPQCCPPLAQGCQIPFSLIVHTQLPTTASPKNQPEQQTPGIKNLRKPNVTQLHRFGWFAMIISWHRRVLECRWEVAGWSRRRLVSAERVRTKRSSETQRKFCLRVKAKSQTLSLFPYRLIAKMNLRMQRESKEGMESEKTFTIGHLWV